MFLRFGVEDVWRVGVDILSVEAESYPAVAGYRELDMSLRCRRHSRRVEDEEFLAFLIADPEFRLIGRQADSMGTMTNRLGTRNHAVQSLAGFQVDNVKADSLPQTYIRDGIGTVHGVREYAVLAHIF